MVKNLLTQRDRLLRRTARVSGLSFTILSALCILVPYAIPRTGYLLIIPLFLLLTVCQILAGARASLGWQWGVVGSGLVLILAISAVSAAAPTPAAIAAIESLGAAAVASVAIVLTISRRRLIALSITCVTVLVVTDFSTLGWEDPIRTTGLVLLGWSLSTIVGLWILVGVPRAQRRITSIGLAHQTQQAASEREAQRRHSARLLHDTVLSTLTLLAHSGVGVSAQALKEQAFGDAALLRQLRLGGSPTPASSGNYSLEQGGISVLGTTLTAVKKKFGLLGLAVKWHGCGEVRLPLPVRDAFLLALVECLENVRRHSGVIEAHVTITEDESTVRAIVTDPGVGFDFAEIDSSRLGFAESVVGRLRDVGGRARLFSAAGAGTTVILEVPR